MKETSITMVIDLNLNIETWLYSCRDTWDNVIKPDALLFLQVLAEFIDEASVQ